MVNNDKIVYEVVTLPGGVDGRDHTDKGGVVVFASFDKGEAHNKALGHYHKVQSRIIDVEEIRRVLLASLTPTEKLVLGLPTATILLRRSPIRRPR